MQQYEQYKDSGVDWLGDIPAHWDLIKMKYAFEERNIKGYPDEPLLSSTQLYGVIPQSMYENRTVVATKGLETLKLVSKGDFIISLRSFQGGLEYAYYQGIISPAYTVLKPCAINNQYFRHLGKSNIYIQLLKSCVTGIREGQNIDYNILKRNFLPLPPLAEQTAIANFLDTKCEQIDRAVAQKEKVVELLNERRQILIQRAVTRGLNPDVELRDSGIDWIGQIPAHWEVKRLKNVISQLNIKEQSINSSLMYIGMENIESWTGKYILTESTVEGLANRFNKGNILFGKLRPYLAKVFLAENEGICSTEFMVFDARQNNKSYIQKLLISPDFISIVNASTYGSKMPRASVEFINNTFIPLPPLAEQTAIADYLDNVNEKIERAIALKREEIDKLKEYKQTLINSAVTGKIKIA